jgi:hypothetical protein
MIDLSNGQVAYAALSFGGVLGMGHKSFAIPWSRLRVDTDREQIVLDVDRDRLEDAPGFDMDDWPDMADPQFRSNLDRYFGPMAP